MKLPKFRSAWLAGMLLLVAFALVVSQAGAAGTSVTAVFELDGNATDSPPGSPDDWQNVFNGDANALATSFVGVSAEPNDVDKTYFTGGGSKDVNQISRWLHSPGDVSPDKDQITDAYAAAYQAANGDLIISFGADRFAAEGDASVGFWFFKNAVAPLMDGSGKFTGEHANGDTLILSDFTNGGKISNIRTYEWQNGKLVLKGQSTLDCRDATSSSSVPQCATVNNQEIESPWPYQPKSGTTNALPIGTFFEGGVNLTDLHGGDPGCFSTFMAETRSSTSVSAQLKDFALGNFNTCDARISIEADDTNAVGTPHTFSVLVEKNAGQGFVPASGVTVNASLAIGSVGSITGGTCQSGTTDAAGNCTVTVNSAVTGEVIVHAEASVNVGPSPIAVQTGAGEYDEDGVKTYVDADISITPATDTNAVGKEHPMTITLRRDLGDGQGMQAFAGETVSAAVTSGTCSFVGASSGTTDANGQLVVTINSSSTQTCVVEATYTGKILAAFAGTQVTRTTDPDAEKVYVDARIKINPATDTNAVGNEHAMTITLERDLGDGNGWRAFAGQTVTAEIKSGSCEFVGANTGTTDANGQLVVKINSSTPQTCVVEADYSGEIVSGKADTQVSLSTDPDAEKVYVDARITITPASATNEVNDPHTMIILLERNLGDGQGWNAFAGEAVEADVTSGSCSFVEDPADATPKATSGATDANGKLNVTINSVDTGLCVVEATYNGQIVSGKVSTQATRTTDPDAKKVYVDAQIDLSPLTDTNGITEKHTVVAKVQQDDGLATDGDGANGFGPAPNGTLVQFSLKNNSADAVFVGGVNSCETAGGNGECSIQIVTGKAGSVDIHATTTSAFKVGGVSLIRATGTGGNNSADANKVYVDGSLTWLKHDNKGNLLGGATFRVCRTHDYNSNSDPAGYVDIEPDQCVSVLDNTGQVDYAGPDQDAVGGKFKMIDLILGRYTVKETEAPNGYALDPDTETVDLSTSSPDGSIATPFVNPQLFKMIVLTCNTTTEKLVVSEVKMDLNGDGDTVDAGETLDTVAVAPDAITDASLCGLDGANYDNLEEGTYKPVVTLPKSGSPS